MLGIPLAMAAATTLGCCIFFFLLLFALAPTYFTNFLAPQGWPPAGRLKMLRWEALGLLACALRRLSSAPPWWASSLPSAVPFPLAPAPAASALDLQTKQKDYYYIKVATYTQAQQSKIIKQPKQTHHWSEAQA